jgi:predicted 3-demethylubiquinone-9 3-methyltransferase (glyoxalase superfamily)
MTPRWHPCLWFDGQAEAAAAFYVSVFPNSRIREVLRYAEGGRLPAGTPLLVDFELDGQPLSALNADVAMPHTHAISLVVRCDSQAELDHYWQHLSAVPEAERCGWLTDRWGVSWQVVPERLMAMLRDPDGAARARVQQALMAMRKIDLGALERAFRGG